MARTQRSPESRLPLKELELVVLLALDEEPLHGYALLTRVAEQSDGFIAPGPASLYRVLAALQTDGLLEEADDYEHPHSNDPRRRYFRASGLGRAVLRAELRRLAGILTAARDRGIRFEGRSS